MNPGYAYGGAYVLTIAIATIWLSNLGDTWSVPELLFYVVVVAAVFFLLFEIKNFRKNHAVIRDRFADWLAMTVLVLGLWTCTYYSTMKAPADFFLAIYFLAAAAWIEFQHKRFVNIVLCLAAAALCFYVTGAATTVTLATSAMAGLFGVAYSHYSKKITDECALSVMGVLSIRFYGLILFAGVWYAFFGHDSQAGIHIGDGWMVVILLAFAHLIIPNFLSQSALQKLGLERLFILMTLLPVVVVLLEGLFFRTWSYVSLAAMIIASLAVNVSQIRERLGLVPGHANPEGPE